MQNNRWYPTCVCLANGDVVIVGGSSPLLSDNWDDTNTDIEFVNATGRNLVRGRNSHTRYAQDERWDRPDSDRRQRNNDGREIAGLYPLAHVLPTLSDSDAPDGLLFILTEEFLRLYNPATNRLIGRRIDVGGYRTWWTQASSVLLPIEVDRRGNGPDRVQIMIIGGGTMGRGNETDPAWPHAEIYDYEVSSRTLRRSAQLTLAEARFMGDGVLWPDGTVIVVGGAGRGYTNNNSSRRSSVEILTYWSGSNRWVSVRATPEPHLSLRGYHATALLLADGRVAIAGGNGNWGFAFPDSPRPEFENFTLETFSPPQLACGPRPGILTAPATLGYGEEFAVTCDRADVADEIVLIRCGSRTHSLDTDQRMLRLTAESTPGEVTRLTATMVRNRTYAPPGPYMLFLLRRDYVADQYWRTPSSARIVTVR
jgi:hypothetical protein